MHNVHHAGTAHPCAAVFAATRTVAHQAFQQKCSGFFFRRASASPVILGSVALLPCVKKSYTALCCFFFFCALQLGWSGRKGQWSDNVVVAHCWLLFVGVTGMFIFLCCNLSFRIIFPSPLLLFFTLRHVIVVPMLAWASAYSLSLSLFFFADSGTNMEKKIKKKHSLDLGLLYVT